MPDKEPFMMEDTDPVEGRYSFLIHRINAHLARLCNPMFRRWGVDIDLARMLAILDQEGAMAAGDIVRVMALPQSTVSHQLKRLEDLCYVTRATNPQDSRVSIISLTEAGESAARDSNALSREVNELLEAALAELDSCTFAEGLKRIDTRLAALSTIGWV